LKYFIGLEFCLGFQVFSRIFRVWGFYRFFSGFQGFFVRVSGFPRVPKGFLGFFSSFRTQGVFKWEPIQRTRGPEKVVREHRL
jgi:hypothetical protein